MNDSVTNTPGSNEAVKSVGPVWIFKLVNPLMKGVLRSPLHRLMSNYLMLLTYQGRKTGKSYTNPVGYFQWSENEVAAFTSRRWWTNLLDSRQVTLNIKRQQVEAVPTIIHEQAEVIAFMPEVIRRLGSPSGLQMALGLPKDRVPTADDFRAIPPGRTIIIFKIVGG